jgi:arginyl-tRNA synthetase
VKAHAEDVMSAAMRRHLPAPLSEVDPLVRPSEHADFQSNIALALAKQAGSSPRALAEELRAGMVGGPFTVTVSGPGFLNLTVADRALWGLLSARLAYGGRQLGVGSPLTGSRVVVDYSGPNIAKEMHVGHLRATVIGDCLARVLGFLGAEVVRQNHLGDWGTNFGMLIQYLQEHRQCGPAGNPDVQVSELDGLYRTARKAFDADPGFAERARRRVVALQGGDEATLAGWRGLVEVSTRALQMLYDRLGVLLTPADVAAESSYNPELDGIAEELTAAGIAVESDGALCVFFDDMTGADGRPLPLMVRKQDGGYGYAATDLATLRHRVVDLAADRILYVVDARQALHFHMVFATARRAGWLPDRVEVVHVPFGTVMAPDGKPFRSRSGDTVRLSHLLDQAVEAARAATADKPSDLSEAERERVVAAAGIGAVKYADLATSRAKNYVFDIDGMVALNGNTGVYLQYAHARVRSILARAAAADMPGHAVEVALEAPLHPAERALILQLDAFGAVLAEVAAELEPHRLCGYLFALAKAFTDFYGACPVLKAESAELRGNRLALCALTGDTLAQGLELLGLQAPARM